MMLKTLIATTLIPWMGYGQVQAQERSPSEVESEHYRVISEGPEEEARDWAGMLEQHFVTLTGVLGKAPRLGEGEKLEVYFYETKERMNAALWTIESTRNNLVGSGFCMVLSRRVFVARWGTPEQTRGTLLHEATHQFEYALFGAVEKEREDLGAAVLREGLAHMMEAHSWIDGKLQRWWPREVLRSPFVFEQLEAARAGFFSVDGLFKTRLSSTNVQDSVSVGRAKARLLVWFLLEGNGDKSRQKLLAYLRTTDRGQVFEEVDFWKIVGAWSTLEPKFKAWVNTLLPEWGVVWGDFSLEEEGLSGGGEGLSLIRSGAPLHRIAAMAQLLPGEDGDLGLMVQYRPFTYKTYAMIKPDGSYRVFAYDGRRDKEIATGKVRNRQDGYWKLEATHTKEGIEIKINKKVVHLIPGVDASSMGFATGNCRAVFSKVNRRE